MKREAIVWGEVLTYVAALALTVIAGVIEYAATGQVSAISAAIGAAGKLVGDAIKVPAERAAVWSADTVERVVQERFGADLGTVLRQFGVEEVVKRLRDALVAETDATETEAETAIARALAGAKETRAV